MAETAAEARRRRARAAERASYSDLSALVRFRPLDKPVGSATEASPFKAGWSKTVRLLARELDMLKARHVVLMIDMRETDFRADGLPRADRTARTPGVVLTLESTRAGGAMRLYGTKYDDWKDNVRAVALSLEALRAVDRYGVTKTGEQYRGWLALPMGSGSSASRGVELVEEHGSIAAALKATHPDTTGSDDDDDYRSIISARELGMVT